MKSIQDRWALFQSMAVAHGSSNELRAELRIAFFAGFTASLGANREIVRMRDADALDAIEQLEEEASAFADSMGAPINASCKTQPEMQA